MFKCAGRIENQAMVGRCRIIWTAMDEWDVPGLDSVARFRSTLQSGVW